MTIGATLLSVVGEFIERVGLVNPGAIFASADTGIKQMWRLLEESCIDLSQRGVWQSLVRETVLTTLAQEDQGDINTLTGAAGFDYWLPNTWWDRTNKLPLYHPATPTTWAALKALNLSGPRYIIRVRNNRLLVNPVPTAGLSWAFEWVTSCWAKDIALAPIARFTADTNTILLPKDVVIAALKWSWKKEKGLNYAEDFATAERLIVNSLARIGGAPILSMDNCADDSDARARIIVPGSNWPL